MIRNLIFKFYGRQEEADIYKIKIEFLKGYGFVLKGPIYDYARHVTVNYKKDKTLTWNRRHK